MEEKYKDIYNKLKTETESTLKNKNTQQYIQEFRDAVKSRLQEVHKKLDEEKEKIISMAIDAYKAQVNQEDNTKPTESKEKETTEKPQTTDDFKAKINDLLSNLDQIMLKTETIEDTIKVFQTSKLSDLVSIKDNNLEFKYERKLKFKLMGKTNWDVKWRSPQNKPENSNIDNDDNQILRIHANSCYNYYQTSRELEDEAILITFETDIYQVNGYLYFGIINELVDLNNNCMCCNIANACYMKCDGNVIVNGSVNHHSSLTFKNPGENKITLRVLPRDKQIYFQVNDGNEVGPITFSGNKFRVTSGSCNAANGYIKLLNAFVIG